MIKHLAASIGAAVVLGLSSASAAILEFENVAPNGSLVNVNPAAPYTEDDFTITPTTNQSAVFDANAAFVMVGRNSSWLGADESNSLMLTGGPTGAFDLISLIVGPSTIAASQSINFTIMTTDVNSMVSMLTFNNLVSATLLNLNLTNLVSVKFSASDDFALDNISLESAVVPAPAALPLFLSALIGGRLLRRRRAG